MNASEYDIKTKAATPPGQGTLGRLHQRTRKRISRRAQGTAKDGYAGLLMVQGMQWQRGTEQDPHDRRRTHVKPDNFPQ